MQQFLKERFYIDELIRIEDTEYEWLETDLIEIVITLEPALFNRARYVESQRINS